MKVYRVSEYHGLEKKEAERKTDKSVWIDGYRSAIHSYEYAHFFTLESAIEYYRRQVNRNIKSAERRLQKYKVNLEEAEKFYQENKQLEEEV